MNAEMIKQVKDHYFEYNGQRYYAGTRFTMKKRNGLDKGRTIVEATFLSYVNGNRNHLYVSYKDMCVKSLVGANRIVIVNGDEMDDIVIDIISGNYYTELTSSKKYCDDSVIPELVVGWPLYIFCMVGSSIFNGRVGGWILITVLFFWWRHKLKTKEYYYYE